MTKIKYDETGTTLEELSIHQLLLEIGRTAVILSTSPEARQDTQVLICAQEEMIEFLNRSPEEREKGMTTNP